MDETLNKIKTLAKESGAWFEERTVHKGTKEITILKISMVRRSK